jgi:predicted kinase
MAAPPRSPPFQAARRLPLRASSRPTGVAVAHRRFGPISSATTSTIDRALLSSAVRVRCCSRATSTTRLPLLSDSAACLAPSRSSELWSDLMDEPLAAERGGVTLVLVTGPPASGKTTLARPLAHHLGLPLLGKDTIKEALFDTLGTGDRAWSRRLGAASYAVLLELALELPAAVLDANFYPDHGPGLLQACQRPIEIFCRCPAAVVERRFIRRAAARHPGHVDHVLDAQLKAALDGAVSPLGLGGPVLEVDTSGPVNVAAVARWVTQQPEWHLPMLIPPTPNQHEGE